MLGKQYLPSDNFYVIKPPTNFVGTFEIDGPVYSNETLSSCLPGLARRANGEPTALFTTEAFARGWWRMRPGIDTRLVVSVAGE
jgi:hypothetical protein